MTGDHVRATGVRMGGVLALSSRGSVSTLSLALPNTLGISFDPNPAVYTKPSQTVTVTTFVGMTDAVTGKKVGAPGASVALTIKKPDGSTITATGTTYRVSVTGTRVRDRTLTHADG